MEIKIFLTNLSAYSRGNLLGKWVTLPANINKEIAEVMAMGEPGDEEWFITDFDAPFHIDEYADLNKLNDIAEELQGLDETETSKITFLMNTLGHTFDQALLIYEDVYYYPGMNLDEVAEELVDSGHYGEIPTTVQDFIDYKAIAYSLSTEGYYELRDGVYFYR